MQNSDADAKPVAANDHDQECLCGHSRYLHADGAGACIEDVAYGVPCRCREFEARPDTSLADRAFARAEDSSRLDWLTSGGEKEPRR